MRPSLKAGHGNAMFHTSQLRKKSEHGISQLRKVKRRKCDCADRQQCCSIRTRQQCTSPSSTLQKTTGYAIGEKGGCDGSSCPVSTSRRCARMRAHLGMGRRNWRLDALDGVFHWQAGQPRQRRRVAGRDQMLPISLTKSSSSFLVSAYFLAISSYFDSHWSRDCSRAWTLRS